MALMVLWGMGSTTGLLFFLLLMVSIVPFQLFAEHVAHRRGVDPDAMRYPGLSARLGIKLRGA